ncbi:MAG TPA: alpha/beta hydrolase [Candidatus Nitrosocosmicus sp.]|nr:alpha/beta hydrolase [Candidatus Nitrosocosmicus sp.]
MKTGKSKVTAISLVFSTSIIVLLLTPNFSLLAGNPLIYASSTLSNSTSLKNTNTTASSSPSLLLENTEAKKIRVGDIEMAYKMFGNGPPLLLIMGSGGTMEEWDQTLLNILSSNHTVIIFDKRGFGHSTFGFKNATIPQYANDTKGLIDAIGVKEPINVLGMSLGGFIAQELALSYPEIVDRLVLFASGCGGKIAVAPVPLADNPIEQMKLLADGMFPDEWKKDHPNFLNYLPIPKVLPTPMSIQSEAQALGSWIGSCDRLSNIINPTLVLVGADDRVTPPSYSIELVQKIHGAWLVQIEDGGHGVMYQYPEKVAKVIETFLQLA